MYQAHILIQVHNNHFRRKTPFLIAALISWTNLSTVTPPTMLDNTEVNTRVRVVGVFQALMEGNMDGFMNV